MARVCVIRQGYFPFDPRVRREVNALVDAGHEVDVVCLRDVGERRFERDGRLTIRRLPPRRRRRGSARYVFEYLTFLVLAAVRVGALHLRRRYDLVQVNTLPDTLVFAAAVPKLTGARVLLDLHECAPEFVASKYKVGLGHPAVRLAARLEQASIRMADLALTCTAQMRDTFVARGAPAEKITVVLNGADEDVFDCDRHPRRPPDPDRFVLVSHGTIEERYGLDTIIRAVALLREKIPGLRLEIFGEGTYLPTLRRLAGELDVEDRVYFCPEILPIAEVVRAIAQADAGVVAMKRDVFRDLTLCNKLYEFIAMRKPAIVSRTRSVEESYSPSCFQFFESDDERDLARAILELRDDPALGVSLVEQAELENVPARWPRQRGRYLGVVDRLLSAPAGGRRRFRTVAR